MADTTTSSAPNVVQEKEEQKATETPSKAAPPTTEPENNLKRSHPEYDDKTKEELVETEKRKIQKIHDIVNEVQEDTEKIDAKIAEARASTNIEERNELISNIKTAATEMKDKVVDAAKLENDVTEINAVLKEKKAQEQEQEGEKKVESAPTTETNEKEAKEPAVTTTQ
jgi:hypothetical protein